MALEQILGQDFANERKTSMKMFGMVGGDDKRIKDIDNIIEKIESARDNLLPASSMRDRLLLEEA